MIREHEELSDEYENLQKELDSLKSRLDNIDYFNWLEESLGYKLDKEKIIKYAKFEIKNQEEWQNEHNKCVNKYFNAFGICTYVCIPVFLFLLIGFSGITNIIILFSVGVLAPLFILIILDLIDSMRIKKQLPLVDTKYDKLTEAYLEKHLISHDMQQLIELGLSDVNAYYRGTFNDNSLFKSMYYRLYDKEE